MELTDLDIETILQTVTIDPTYSHAMEIHPNDAPIVRECLNKKGPYMNFQIEAKVRYLRVCIIDEDQGLIGFQIVDIINGEAKECTAYIRYGIRSIKQLFEYISKKGYTRFKGPL